MLVALCVMGTLLGFSAAVNIVMIAAYGQQVKEIARMKFDATKTRINSDIKKQRNSLFEEVGEK